VGTTFAGYRIERVLGRGGMSIVYLAEHPRLTHDDVLAAQAFAADYLADEEIVYG